MVTATLADAAGERSNWAKARPRLQSLYTNLESDRIPGLAGIRALAAYAVVGFHWLSPYIPCAYAVVTFFVLSGFLITWLLLREQDERGKLDIRRFWIRRALRIFPAFYIFWMVRILLGAGLGESIAAGLYLENYWIAIGGNSAKFGHTWSLGVEEQFYVLWPIAVVWVGQRKLLLKWCIGISIAIQAARFILEPIFGWRTYVHHAFEIRADALLIGCALAVMLSDRVRVPEWLLSRWAMLFPIALILICDTGRMESMTQWGCAIVAYAAALLIVQVIAVKPKVLEDPVMEWGGAISYSVYLYHGMGLEAVRALQLRWPLDMTAAFAFPTILASLSYLLVERPVNCLRQRFLPQAPLGPPQY